MSQSTNERMQELAGIINSKGQLVKAAGKLADEQLQAAQVLLQEDPQQQPSDKAIQIAKLIAMNMSAHDLISK